MGVIGHRVSKKTRLKMSKSASRAMRKRWKNPEYRETFSRAQSIAQKRRFEDPEERRKTRIRAKKAMLKRAKDPDWIATRLEVARRPEVRRKIGKANRKHLLEQYASGRRKPGNGFRFCKKGWFMTMKGEGGVIYYDSGWERAFLEIIESAKIVKRFKKEPFRIPYKYKGVQHTFFPDFLLELQDGSKFVVEVKGQAVDRRQTMAKFKAACEWCEKRGYEFVVIREKPIAPITDYLQ